MPITKYQQRSYQWLGPFLERRTTERYKELLQAAHMEIRADAYLSFVAVSTVLVGLTVACVSCFLLLVLFPAILLVQLPLAGSVLLVSLPFLLGALTFATLYLRPSMRAKARKKKIDANLPYAVNFISAMASAGVPPTEIFRSLSKQEIYSELSEEAAWIYRDVSVLGMDILSAIKANIKRTPSQLLKEFLQGMVVTVTSGGSLKTYFMHKAEQFMWQNRQTQKQLIETLGIMAESYVTAAVAGILMILIVIPLMMLISQNFNETFLYILVFVVVPIVHLGFAGIIKIMWPGV